MLSQESQRTKLLQVGSVGTSYILLLNYNNNVMPFLDVHAMKCTLILVTVGQVLIT